MHKNTRKEDWNNSTYINYPLLYVQRWIPFNAWYSTVIDGKKDSDAISSFKINTDNKLYEVIKQYLKHTKDDFYGIEFCFHLSCLDDLLVSNVFPNSEERICFGETKIRQNDKRESTFKQDGVAYKVERDAEGKPRRSVSVIIQDIKTTKVKHTICIPKHDVALMKNELKTAKVAKNEQKVVWKLFKEVEPTITVDVKETKLGVLKIGKKKFTSDLNSLCSSIVDVLYNLRCKAVHGEIDLDNVSCLIYEHAYFILECILRKLF